MYVELVYVYYYHSYYDYDYYYYCYILLHLFVVNSFLIHLIFGEQITMQTLYLRNHRIHC